MEADPGDQSPADETQRKKNRIIRRHTPNANARTPAAKTPGQCGPNKRYQSSPGNIPYCYGSSGAMMFPNGSPGQYSGSPQYGYQPQDRTRIPHAYSAPGQLAPMECYQERQDYRQRSGQQQRQTPGSANKGRGQKGATPGSRGKNQQRGNSARKTQIWEKYMEAEEVQKGLKRGELIEAPIRINPKHYDDAFVPHPDGYSDIYICGMKDRNRALNGDIVVVQLYPRSQWKVFQDIVEDAKNFLSRLYPNEFPEENTKKEKPGSTGSKDADSTLKEHKEGADVKENKLVETEPILKGDKETQETTKMPTETSDVKDRLLENCEDGKRTENALPGVDTHIDSMLREKCNVKHDEAQNDCDQTPCKTESAQKNSQKTQKSSQKANRSVAERLKNQSGNTKSHTPNRKFTMLGEFLGQHVKPANRKLTFDEGTSEDESKAKEADLQKKMEQFPLKYIMRTGKVVYISEKKHSRASSGQLRLMTDRNKNLALFSAMDSRFPRLMIPMEQCPQGFYERSEDYKTTIFIARMTRWEDTSMFAFGELSRSIGEAGQIEPETQAMLVEYGVDDTPFADQVLACLPQDLPWSIPQEELENRRDLRKECIFTIDPATARDLDDALHCNYLGDGMYEVGVHIADVSYFVKEDNALDAVAADRSTSVYLVQKVVPMLPRLLCEQLCSLNPDQDRLTFSVIWKLNEKGEVFDEWFGRSIIRSCAKLSYSHAQGFIEEPEREWKTEELPAISKGFSIAQIVERVLNLNKIAVNLHRKRFDDGALRLDQVKLQYTLNMETGMPNGYFVYQQQDSNRLVEEFMLLANMAVAHKLYRDFPQKAFLRRHPPPQGKMIDDLVEMCEHMGIPVDASSAGALQRSIHNQLGDDFDAECKRNILTVMWSKPMQNARYFCSGMIDNDELFHHYALNVPLYTHFTSPIRRYPDLVVHRLLGAALGYCEEPKADKHKLTRVADHCNDKKMISKIISDRSSEIFFAVFVKECGPLEEDGMVMGVLDQSFDVLVLKLGVVKRVYCERLPLKQKVYQKQHKRPVLTLTWAANDQHKSEVTQTITIFTKVRCTLQGDKDPLKWSATIKHPDDTLEKN